MNDDSDTWALALNIPPAMAADFKRLAAGMALGPVDVFRKMVERLITLNRHVGDHGLGGIEVWWASATSLTAPWITR